MKKNRWLLCIVTVLIVVLCAAMVACDEDPDPSGSQSDICKVTFAGVKTVVVDVEKGQKVAKPEAEQKKSGYSFIGWYLGNSLYDFDTPVNEDIVLEAKFERDKFDMPHGVAFGVEGGGYMSGSSDALLVFNDQTFSGGTFTASVIPGTSNDCGVIFGLSDDRDANFWEEERYFCAIINKDGFFILAEIIPGATKVWNEVTNSDAFEEDYSPTETYTFKVGYAQTSDPAKGFCKIELNGVVVAEKTINALSGSGIGYRAQNDGVKFSEISIDVNNIPDVVDRSAVGDLRIKHGQLALDEYDDYVALSSDTIALYKDSLSGSGKYSVSVTMTKGAAAEDDGIVFGLSDNGQSEFWENGGVSYYFFFISRDNAPYLGKVDSTKDKPWEAVKVGNVLSIATTYQLKVEVDGNTIKCYVDNTLVIDETIGSDMMLTGNLVGIRAGGSQTIYKDFTVAETPIQAE